MENYCPQCDRVYPSDARICTYCGVMLHAFSRRPPHILPTGKLETGFILKLRYHIIHRVGKGGFSAVYKAVDTQFNNRIVAIKEMSLHKFSPDETFEASYVYHQEVRMLASLTHPNLPRIYDNFPHAGRWYLVMDFIEGETLDQYLYETMSGHIPMQKVLDIGIQLCNVMGYLHTRKPPVIFRDLKPLNIMRTPDGMLYLIDFGIARHFKIGQARDTIPFGTPGYSAPESAYTQSNPRSDIYSLGVTLHELLTASDPTHNPIHAGSLHSYNRSIPAKLENLIMQMIESDPEKRPDNMAMIKQQLQSIQFQLQWTKRVRNSRPMERNIAGTNFDSRAGGPALGSTLYVKKGTVPGKIFRLDNKITNIGRDYDSDIFLEDRFVSRFHASLHRLGNGKYTIQDKGSMKGTFINGQRLISFKEYPLYDKDEIKIGNTLLIFRK